MVNGYSIGFYTTFCCKVSSSSLLASIKHLTRLPRVLWRRFAILETSARKWEVYEQHVCSVCTVIGHVRLNGICEGQFVKYRTMKSAILVISIFIIYSFIIYSNLFIHDAYNLKIMEIMSGKKFEKFMNARVLLRLRFVKWSSWATLWKIAVNETGNSDTRRKL